MPKRIQATRRQHTPLPTVPSGTRPLVARDSRAMVDVAAAMLGRRGEATRSETRGRVKEPHAPRVETLDSGARVVIDTEPSARARTCSLQLWIAAGTAAERPHEHGVAHFLEHLVFKPHRDGPDGPVDLATAVEALGGDVNAYTTHDETCVYVTAPAPVAVDALEELFAAVLRPRLTHEEIDRERAVVIEEIHQYDDDPSAATMDELASRLFPAAGYGRPVLGRPNELKAHDRRVVGAFHRRWYRPEHLTLVVTGPVDEARVRKLAKRWLAGPPRDAARVGPKLASQAITAPIGVATGDVSEAHVRLGWVGPAVTSPDAVALEVAANVLGSGESCRLALRTRRRDRLVSDAHAGHFAFVRSGMFLVSARTTGAKAERATRALLAEVETLRTTPPSHEEFERARNAIESSLVYRRETVQGRAQALGYYAALLGDLDAEARYFAALRALNPETVRDAVARWLVPEHLAAVVRVPPRAKTQVVKVRRLLKAAAKPAGPVPPSAGRKSRAGASLEASKPRNIAWLRPLRDLPESWGGRSVNGLEVRALVDTSVPMMSGLVVWRGGLLTEPRRDAGATQLAASLLTRGTRTRDGDTLAAEIEGMAASIEGFCGRNSVGLQLECLAQHQSEVIRRVFDCALEPAFAEHEFEEERRVTIEELISEEDDLGTVAYRTMMRGLYGQHAYARDVRGDTDSLRRLTRDRVEASWTGRHPLSKALLVLVGDVDLDALVRDVDGLASLVASSSNTAPARGRKHVRDAEADELDAPRWPTRERELEVRRRKAQAHLAIGYPGVHLADPRRATIDVLATVLGGQSGRLFRVLREELGLVYHVSAGATSGLTAGHFKIVAACSQANLDPTRAAIDRELQRVIEEPVPEEELERARAHLLGGFDAGLQRRSRIAAHLAFGELYGLGRLHELGFPARLARVTAKDVAKVARELLGGTNRVVGIVRA